MSDKIIMPKMGESITEGTIIKWLKLEGDYVEKDESILIISTDKVEAEIPASSSGVVLKVIAKAGDTLSVGSTLGYIGNKDESAADQKEDKFLINDSSSFNDNVLNKAEQIKGNIIPYRHFISPLVRKMAAENSINDGDFNKINGTGINNRITKKDLLKYLEERGKIKPICSENLFAEMGFSSLSDNEERKTSSNMRRLIMANMVASKKTSAHVTTFFKINYDKITKIILDQKNKFKQAEGVPLTYTVFIIGALCLALKKHPYLNAEVKDGDIYFKKNINIGVAVSLSDPEPGLIVPTIRGCNKMSLTGIAHALSDLSERARLGKLKPDELKGGTFTITNPGKYGAVAATPIINQPQVAILGVGGIHREPIVIKNGDNESIGIGNIGWISLSFDHRAVDGVTADSFMLDLKKCIESWTILP